MPSASQFAALYILVTAVSYWIASSDTSASPVRIWTHLTGDTAQLLIADGEGGHAAAGADARLAAYHGHPGGDDHIGDGFGVVGRRVVGGDIDHIGAVTGRLGHGGEVVHVGEGVLVQV